MKRNDARQAIIAVTTLVALVGCSGSESRAIEAIKRDAKDPQSVQVRNLTDGTELPESKVLCGEWNTKNGYGGMGDWEGFMLRANADHPLYIPPEGKPDPDGVREIAKGACPGITFP